MPPNPMVAIRMRSLGETLWPAPASPAAVSMAGPLWRKCLLVDIAGPFYRRTHALGGAGAVAACGGYLGGVSGAPQPFSAGAGQETYGQKDRGDSVRGARCCHRAPLW